MPPARLLITAVRTASARSVSPPAAPPELISPARPIAVGQLVAHQIDGVIAGQFAVYPIVGIAEVNRFVAAVILRHLLLNDIGADGGRRWLA